MIFPPHFTFLRNLGLEYLNLYLVHWPLRVKQGAVDLLNLSKEDHLPFDMHGTWKAMEDANKLGLAKSIGVSNFSCEKLSKLLRDATIPPAVNQVDFLWHQLLLLLYY